MTQPTIEIRGAREHNLDVPFLSLPKNRLVVFCGPSGSGKSSLAFDTLFREGQRRYVESLSSYARQFLDQSNKPAFEHLRGLSPTVAIEQKTASRNPRSTVGTMTEIHDYLRVLYARFGTQHCPSCGHVVQAMSTGEILQQIATIDYPILVLAPLATARKGTFSDVLSDLAARGFIRVRHNGKLTRLDPLPALRKNSKHTIELVVDRVVPSEVPSDRLADSVETALREGAGTVVIVPASDDMQGDRHVFNQHMSCPSCGIGTPAATPQSFSFNSPAGMCPTCNGLGKRLEMDPKLVIPDPSLTIRQGAIEPLASTMERGSGWTYELIAAVERDLGVDLDIPWKELPPAQKRTILHGSGDKLINVTHVFKTGEFNRRIRFEGILPTLTRRYQQTKSEAMQAYYQKYQSEASCPDCKGKRLRNESLAVRLGGLNIAEVSALPVSGALEHFIELSTNATQNGTTSTHGQQPAASRVARPLLQEIIGRLEFLQSVGLGYLSLDRAGPTLSGGEAQRIRLASQIGSELSGVLYVLDEPSIGLHARDNARLLQSLERLRDLDNTVIVVEHDEQTIRRADHVVEFGPGAGALGGKVVFSGSPKELLDTDTTTARFLTGRERIEKPASRRKPRGHLHILGARANNLRDIDIAIPLGCFVAVTGVSGAGKSSLVSGILHPALAQSLHHATAPVGEHDALRGLDQLDKVVRIDQSPIGRTPRSNPATYTKAFDLIRGIFAQTKQARAMGFTPGRFSFNVKGGRCDACKGDGVQRVEMHFLPDVFVRCEVCGGKRYNEATLQVRYRERSIADVLDMTVREALELFKAHPKLARVLQTLFDVGLDYIKLGQPATTLSGGEAQRIKLARELAKVQTGRTLYLLDEPTTGLHFEDIRRLLAVLDKLIKTGNTVLVIEHNLDVIRHADHLIDLGPEGGRAGGAVVAQGTPEQVARVDASHTGRALREEMQANLAT